MRWRTEILLLAGLLHADDGLAPRAKLEDFPVFEKTEKLAIGAEFMVHSFGRDSDRYVHEDYLTVEVGVYPINPIAPLLISRAHFTLRVNGKKEAILADTPGMVSMSLKYHDWDQESRRQEGPGQTGGPRQAEPRFPGDNRPAKNRLPDPPQAPEGTIPTGRAHVAPSELLREVALDEKEHKLPSGGYLYFPFRGKLKSIKTLDLIYNNGPESITLRLR